MSSRETNLKQVLRLEVPVVVRLGERQMSVREVINLVPGAIIELDKQADKELDLLINDKPVGQGHAVKVGENFGLRLTFIGDVSTRVDAALSASAANMAEDQAAADLAAQLLAGQL